MATDNGVNSYHEEEALGKAYDARLMKRLLKYLRHYRLPVTVAVVLLLMSSLSQIALVFLVKTAIDDHIMNGVRTGFTLIVLAYFLLKIKDRGTV